MKQLLDRSTNIYLEQRRIPLITTEESKLLTRHSKLLPRVKKRQSLNGLSVDGPDLRLHSEQKRG